MVSFKQPGPVHSLSVHYNKSEARVCGQQPLDLMTWCRSVQTAFFSPLLFLHRSDGECRETLGLWEGLTNKYSPGHGPRVEKDEQGCRHDGLHPMLLGEGARSLLITVFSSE